MMSLAEWLQSVGLERYAEVFERNDVDLAVLPSLTDADLQQLGLSLGHRRKLLAALADLSTPSSAVAPAAAPTPVPPAAERRQLTVLFCDMVGYTELASRLDPEVLQGIVRGYEDTCAACVTRFEGYVFQRLGDGIVAFFGYPLAHEGQAERAIRAGLEIIDAKYRPDKRPVLRPRRLVGESGVPFPSGRAVSERWGGLPRMAPGERVCSCSSGHR